MVSCRKTLILILLSLFLVSELGPIGTVRFGAAQGNLTMYIISGYVFDPTGKVVSGAFVYNINSTGLSYGPGCFSNSSGFYSMTVPSGTYWLIARGLSGSGTSYSERNIVVNSNLAKNITLVAGCVVSGYILDSSGKGVAGTETNVYNSSWSVPVFHTDSSGYYALFIPAGTYTFIVWPPYNTSLVDYDNSAFVLNSDLTQNITLISGFKVSGYVRYPSGETVPNVPTWLTNNSGSIFLSGLRSDSSGFYYVAAPAGNYMLVARGLSGLGTSYSEPNIVLIGDITKNITLIAVSISPASAILNVGQYQLFTAISSGGSGTYTTYNWYVNGSLRSGQTGSTFNFSPDSAGSYSIYATVTDSSGATSSQSTAATVTASAPPPTPTIAPTPTPSSIPTATPKPSPTSTSSTLASPVLTVTCASSTSYTAFKVEIDGTITNNGTSISGAPISVFYSITGGKSWQDLTLVNSAPDGSFSAEWLPSATGNYLINATFTGDSSYSRASSVVNLGVTPFISQSAQDVFSVASNSTVSDLVFNSTSKELDFAVSGPAGTTGFVDAYIAKSLIGDVSTLRVELDGNQINYTVKPTVDSWLVHFTYHHSAHIVTMSLGAAATQPVVETPLLESPIFIAAIVGVGVIFTVTILLLLRAKRDKSRSQK